MVVRESTSQMACGTIYSRCKLREELATPWDTTLASIVDIYCFVCGGAIALMSEVD